MSQQRDYPHETEVLESLAASIGKRDVSLLRSTGAQLSEDAFAANSQELADLSACAYSIAKFLEKHYIVESPRWPGFALLAVQKLTAAAEANREGRHEEADKAIDSLVDDVEALSQSLGRFQTDVLTKARMKIATDAYAHGASLGRACAFAGVGKKAVLEYIGATRLSDKFQTENALQRLAAARKLFAPVN